jgi:hypothetical protein
VIVLVTFVIKWIYNVERNTKRLYKIAQIKDEIGHSCNLVEKKPKLHPNLKNSCISNHL